MKSYVFMLTLMFVDVSQVSDASQYVVYTKADFQNAVYRTAKKNHLNPQLALAVAEVESSWVATKERAEKKGNTYSVGLFQMYLPTAADMGFKGDKEALKNPDTNIRLGIAHLKKCQRRFGNDVRKVACCHNAGPHVRVSVCHNDEWVIHYQNKVEKAYSTYKGFKL